MATDDDTPKPEAIYERYRPTELDQIFGQDGVIKSLNGAISRGDTRQFLFTGPFGTGKTTLARITCAKLGIDDIIEKDAATNRGIDAMRAIQDLLLYRPMNGKLRAIILDEAHRLTGDAWDSLLKVTEEPPDFAFWFLCTTNPAKVPATIKSRFTTFVLRPISEDDLHALLDGICQAEGVELPDGFASLIVKASDGSARQALSNLAAVRDLETRQEAADALRQVLETDAGHKLCQFLSKGRGAWTEAMRIIEKLDGNQYESLRIQVRMYLSACAQNAKSDKQAVFFLSLMSNWEYKPGVEAEAKATVIDAIGRCLFR